MLDNDIQELAKQYKIDYAKLDDLLVYIIAKHIGQMGVSPKGYVDNQIINLLNREVKNDS